MFSRNQVKVRSTKSHTKDDKNVVGNRTVVDWKVIALCGLFTSIWPLLSFAEESVPDWTAWKCTEPIISFNVIETYECYLPSDEQSTAIQLRVSGRTVPFLIGWNYVNQAENPIANAYAALYKDGRWIVGRVELVSPQRIRGRA